MKVQTSRS